MSLKYAILFFVLNIFVNNVSGQPDLEVIPEKIVFESRFNRLERVAFVNEGNATLIIDSIKYLWNRYYIRWDEGTPGQIVIQPGDTLGMDCILTAFSSFTIADTVDTMFVYTNEPGSLKKVKIKLDFFDEEYKYGYLNGQITTGGSPVENATVYFFHEGHALVDSVVLNTGGVIRKNLPVGNYIIAAVSSNSYLTLSGNTTNFLNAEHVKISQDSTSTIEINLIPLPANYHSISGVVTDSLSHLPVKKGVIVVRKGTHTPGKPERSGTDTLTSFAGIINDYGQFYIEGISEAGYYYIQAFSDYYLPSYYTTGATTAIFWQDADSVYISGSSGSFGINMRRDSSFGFGVISGIVNSGMYNNSSNPGEVLLFAISENTGSVVSPGLTSFNGNFAVSRLPFGSFRIRAQKIGYSDFVSPVIIIDSLNTNYSGLFLLISGLLEKKFPVVNEFIMLENYPNPFNPTTVVNFAIPRSSEVNLQLYSTMGEFLKEIENKRLEKGNYEYQLNLHGFSSGTYYLVLRGEGFTSIRKIMLMK